MQGETIETRIAAAVTLHLPLALRPEVGGAGTVPLRAASAADALAALFARFPVLRRHILDENGGLRPHVNVFVNDADARTLGGLAAPLADGDDIHVVPSIAGG